MTIDKARIEAKQLSEKQWNRYFHVIKKDDSTYYVDRYYSDKAICYFLKGNETKHIIKKR